MICNSTTMITYHFSSNYSHDAAATTARINLMVKPSQQLIQMLDSVYAWMRCHPLTTVQRIRHMMQT